VGYLQSCLWQGPNFETFDDICNFPTLHTENGDEAYIIFLATHPDYRHQGVASDLLKTKTTLAAMQVLNTLSLVAKTELIPLYQKNGFDTARDMPNFLPHSTHTLMQKTLKTAPTLLTK
jgi:ribosomal protein S18 acetylase RimI-like enzyme